MFTADVVPYFDFQTLSIGVSVTLSALFEQTVADLICVVSDYGEHISFDE